jgi:transposase
MPYADTEAMNKHLEEIGKAVTPGAHAALVFDGAGWHGSGGLIIPENITPITLPAYSPELNPVENVWEYLRKNKLANRLYQTYEDIVDACCDAWNSLIEEPDRIASIAQRSWAKAS